MPHHESPRSSTQPQGAEYASPKQQRPHEMLVAIMGTTGAGKSKFIKTLTGDQSIIEGHNLQSCTQTISSHQAVYNSQKIIFVDTPGFDDTNRKDTEILQQLAGWLSTIYEAGYRLSGIIYLHRITDNRMAGSALRNLRVFRKLCGNDVMSNVVLTTTHWDTVDSNRAAERETELRNTYWKGMLERGSKIHRFDGSRDAAWNVVAPLLDLDRIVLNIQRELVDQHKTVAQTDAGQVVNEELEKAQKKYQEEIRALKEEWAQAAREKDEEMKKILEEEKKHAEARLHQVKQEQEEFMKVQREEMERKNSDLRKEIRRIQEESSGGLIDILGKVAKAGIGFLVAGPPGAIAGFMSDSH